MDTITTARRLAGPIGEFGARFMLDPATFSRSAELGLPASLASYVQGRIGVMGELDTATVIDNKLFFDEGLVARYWEEPCRLSKSEAGVAYASICAERGAAYLDGLSDAARLAELLERVADSADDSEAALFAGWRDAARPSSAEAFRRPGATADKAHRARDQQSHRAARRRAFGKNYPYRSFRPAA